MESNEKLTVKETIIGWTVTLTTLVIIAVGLDIVQHAVDNHEENKVYETVEIECDTDAMCWQMHQR